ncbi:hypothetical protein ACHAWF_012203 [Thalassiosira exigua]
MKDPRARRAHAARRGGGALGSVAAAAAAAVLLLSLAAAAPRRTGAFSPPATATPASSSSTAHVSSRPSDGKRNRPLAFARSAGATRLLVTFAPDEEGEGEPAEGVGNAVGDAGYENDDDGGGVSFPLDLEWDGSLLSNAGALALFLLVGSFALQLTGAVGGALLRQLAVDLAVVATNILHLAATLLAALFGILKHVLPFVGKGLADGATTAAPAVAEAAQRAAESAAPVLEEVGRAAAPMLDGVGRAVDEGVVDPLRQAVDATVVDPLQDAAEAAGKAVDESVLTPLQQVVDATVVDPIRGAARSAAEAVGQAVDEAMPDMPDLPELPALPKVEPPEMPRLPDLPELPEPSVRIGDVRMF